MDVLPAETHPAGIQGRITEWAALFGSSHFLFRRIMEPMDKWWWIATIACTLIFILFLTLTLIHANKLRGAKVLQGGQPALALWSSYCLQDILASRPNLYVWVRPPRILLSTNIGE